MQLRGNLFSSSKNRQVEFLLQVDIFCIYITHNHSIIKICSKMAEKTCQLQVARVQRKKPVGLGSAT
jgi:hypothetical protein